MKIRMHYVALMLGLLVVGSVSSMHDDDQFVFTDPTQVDVSPEEFKKLETTENPLIVYRFGSSQLLSGDVHGNSSLIHSPIRRQDTQLVDCPICLTERQQEDFIQLNGCPHSRCIVCHNASIVSRQDGATTIPCHLCRANHTLTQAELAIPIVHNQQDMCLLCRTPLADIPEAERTQLACQHIFCIDCLRSMVGRGLQTDMQIECPQCFTAYVINPDRVDVSVNPRPGALVPLIGPADQTIDERRSLRGRIFYFISFLSEPWNAIQNMPRRTHQERDVRRQAAQDFFSEFRLQLRHGNNTFFTQGREFVVICLGSASAIFGLGLFFGGAVVAPAAYVLGAYGLIIIFIASSQIMGSIIAAKFKAPVSAFLAYALGLFASNQLNIHFSHAVAYDSQLQAYAYRLLDALAHISVPLYTTGRTLYLYKQHEAEYTVSIKSFVQLALIVACLSYAQKNYRRRIQHQQPAGNQHELNQENQLNQN